MPSSSATDKTISQLNQLQQQKGEKFDYLKAKYIFRYPFTFTSIKWGFVIGSFLGLHTFIKSRNLRKSFEYMIWGSFFMTFPIWAFFMTKYSFYQSSIQNYEQEQIGNVRSIEMYKRYIEFKLKLPSNHQIQEEQLMQKYSDYLKYNFDRNCQLDCLLTHVNTNSYDLKIL